MDADYTDEDYIDADYTVDLYVVCKESRHNSKIRGYVLSTELYCFDSEDNILILLIENVGLNDCDTIAVDSKFETGLVNGIAKESLFEYFSDFEILRVNPPRNMLAPRGEYYHRYCQYPFLYIVVRSHKN